MPSTRYQEAVMLMAKAYKILMLIENTSAPFDNRVWAEATALRDYGFQVSIISHGSVIFREVLEIQHSSWSYRSDDKSNRAKMRCWKADKGVR